MIRRYKRCRRAGTEWKSDGLKLDDAISKFRTNKETEEYLQGLKHTLNNH